MYISLKKNVFCIALCFSFLFIQGCFPKGRVSYVEHFVIDYDPSAFENTIPLDTTIKIERFSIMEIYNNTRMYYKGSPFKLNSYVYSRWRVNPADLLSDYFLRDLVNANIFSKVFSYKDPYEAVFSLEAGIEEFLEIIEEGKPYSVLTLNIALLDNREIDITKKIIFQKKYREKEPMQEHNAESFAKGMSIAFKKISFNIIDDIYKILKQKYKITLN